MESVMAGVSKHVEDFDVSSFGESMDKQRATLAYDVGCDSLSSTMLGKAIGTACTFSSGFLVLQSARTGHLVLRVLRRLTTVPCVAAPCGLMWVLVTDVAGVSSEDGNHCWSGVR